MTPELVDLAFSVLDDSEVLPEVANPIAWLRDSDISVLEEEFPGLAEWYQKQRSAGAARRDGCTEHGRQDEGIALDNDHDDTDDVTAAVDEEEEEDMAVHDDDDDQSLVGPTHAQTLPSTIQTQGMEPRGQNAVDRGGVAIHSSNGSARRGSSLRESKKRSTSGKASLLGLAPESRASDSIHSTAKRRARANTPPPMPQYRQGEVTGLCQRVISPIEYSYKHWRKNNTAWVGSLREIIDDGQKFSDHNCKVSWQCPHCSKTFSRDDGLTRHAKMSKSCGGEVFKMQVYKDGTLVLDRKRRPVIDHWEYMVGNAPWLDACARRDRLWQ